MNAISDTTSATQTETQPQQMTTIPKKKSWYEICIEEEEEEERLKEEEERKKMKEISDNRKALLAQGKYELEEGEILE
jgi:hypothetical protein